MAAATITRPRLLPTVAMGVSAAAAWALVAPFLRDPSPWTWALDQPDALAGATVNGRAEPTATGVLLTPLPGRSLSLISPAVRLDAADYLFVEIEADCTTEVHPGRGQGGASTSDAQDPGDGAVQRDANRPQPLKFLWQESSAVAFRSSEAVLAPGSPSHTVRIDLKHELLWRGAVARIGVQWPGVEQGVVVRRMTLHSLPRAARPSVAAAQIVAGESLDNWSINYLAGPTILGRGLNYYLGSAAVLAAGAYVAVRSIRRASVRTGILFALPLCAWAAADLHTTLDISRQTLRAAAVLRQSDDPFALMFGKPLTRLRDAIVAHVPPGRTIVILSDDEFYPRYRVGYQITPSRVVLDPVRLADADYIALFYRSGAVFDEGSSRLVVPPYPPVDARIVARDNDDVYLLARIAP